MYSKLPPDGAKDQDENQSLTTPQKSRNKKCFCLEVRNIGVSNLNILTMFLVSFTTGLYEKFNSMVLPFMLQE